MFIKFEMVPPKVGVKRRVKGPHNIFPTYGFCLMWKYLKKKVTKFGAFDDITYKDCRMTSLWKRVF